MLPLWDTEPHKNPPVITTLLILGCIGVFGYESWLMMQSQAGAEAFILKHALVPGRLLAHWRVGEEWGTIFSAMFLHGGVAHLLGNCWFLWIFGNNVEDKLGPFRYLLLYVFAGLVAAFFQSVVDVHSSVPMIGASGAISGVLGAYLILFPRAWVVSLVPWVVPIVPIPAVVFLVLWFVAQTMNGLGLLLADAGSAGGVAWWAHIGGFLAGVYGIRKFGKKTSRR